MVPEEDRADKQTPATTALAALQHFAGFHWPLK
jgi:hypothetical protein